MENEDKFISGIHNYCDRWCERCPFTSRCRAYALEQEIEKRIANRDDKNEAFWSELGGELKKSLTEITGEAHELGFELDLGHGWVDDDDHAESWKPRRKRPRLPTLTKSAEAYMKAVKKFWDDHEKALELKSKTDARLNDANDVILHYFMFVAVKLHRAAHTHEPEYDDEMDEDEAQFERDDADGSAKLVLIGIDRSIQAWAIVRQRLPEHSKTCLEFMRTLVDLRDRVQSSFPNARRFKRPGFDD